MPLYLGIDVGSTTVKVVLTDGESSLLDHAYVHAHGQPGPVLLQTLADFSRRWDLGQVEAVGLTGSGGGTFAPLLGGLHVNELIAQTHALDVVAPHARTVIEMGGQDSKLLILEPDPQSGQLFLADFSMNALCAAGTGSFLDQQAERLGLSIEELAELALKAHNPTRVAGRCTVFAKSDMIHLQQKGVPVPDIVAGLCLAVARNFRGIIGRGKMFRPPILFQGGVAHNAGMIWAFEEVLGLERGALIVPPHCTLMAALGATWVAQSKPEESPTFRGLDPLGDFLRRDRAEAASLPPLHPRRRAAAAGLSRQPDENGVLPVYLGVDVGSISTKVALVDEQGRLVSARYLYTAGRPLEAVREGLAHVAEEVSEKVEVLAAGVTGSGRYLVADYIGADLVRNEITAQARAALALDAQVDTVFEIGGQDSKYIHLQDGVVDDFTMNKACAAGTGSFLEEQAQRLHLSIEEFGPLALTAPCPASLGERCTVFMESDLVHHQQQGAEREDLVAGLAYSIAQNYLSQVVHDRAIGERILFQGGVAANPAVVAAFEQILGRPVVVPPHHEVSGAIGVALLAREGNGRGGDGGQTGSRFLGFDLSRRSYRSEAFECKGCPNHCEVQRVQVAGETRPFFYGARCERYEERAGGQRRGVAGAGSGGNPPPDLFAEREAMLLQFYQEQVSTPGAGTVGLPRALYFYELLPFWSRFFRELGWQVVLSPPTTPAITARAAETAVAETCFPVKLVHGHVLALLEQGVERIFFPSLVNRPNPLPGQQHNYQCPWIQASPQLVAAALEMTGQEIPLWNLPLHFLWPEALDRELNYLAEQMDVPPAALRRAWQRAEEEQRRFREACLQRGREALEDLDRGSYAAVLVGRPYNTVDPGANAGLPLKLRRQGVLALPIDFLPMEGIDIGEVCANMFWFSGQRILAAAEHIRRDPRLQAIYVTNFGCGPDSFLLSYFREAMQGKPFLELELDDHSADAGLITRCEAFFDSLHMRDRRDELADRAPVIAEESSSSRPSARGGAGSPRVVLEQPVDNPPSSKRADEERSHVQTHLEPQVKRGDVVRVPPAPAGSGLRRVYLPNMCDHAYVLAAAMRYHGIPSEVLPPTTDETLAIGRELCLGRECLPCFTSIGDIVQKSGEPGFDPAASSYFMPTTGGPCRFGQYHFRQRHILNRLGLQEMAILSPTAENAYQGFGEHPVQLRRLAWQGVVGVDLLQKLLHEHRPYEKALGSTERLYQDLLQKLVQAVEGGGGRRAVEVMKEAGRRFAGLAVDRRERRPIIGLVGEIYVRANPYTNQDIVRRVEDLGGEVWLATMMEWFYYVNYCVRLFTATTRRYVDMIKVTLVDAVQRRDERRLLRPVEASLGNAHEAPIAHLADLCRPYFAPVLGTEAVMSVGKAVEFAHQGLSGILNVLPFNCMPGTIVAGLSQRIRATNRHIPWLDVIYDAQGETNLHTRLEAFMYQARQFQVRQER